MHTKSSSLPPPPTSIRPPELVVYRAACFRRIFAKALSLFIFFFFLFPDMQNVTRNICLTGIPRSVEYYVIFSHPVLVARHVRTCTDGIFMERRPIFRASARTVVVNLERFSFRHRPRQPPTPPSIIRKLLDCGR